VSKAVVRSVPLFLVLLFACTPKSPNLTPRENLLLNTRDWLEYAQDIRVEVLTSVKTLHDDGNLSDENFARFRTAGQAVEDAQKAVILAQKAYILATTEDKMSVLVDMLRNLTDTIMDMERLWALFGGGGE